MTVRREILRVRSVSPARRRGSSKSKRVAWENMPHPGMPRTGIEPTRATHRRLPGCAGTPLRTSRPPIRSIAVNTGSSGIERVGAGDDDDARPGGDGVLDSLAERRGLGLRIGETRQRRPEPVELLAEDGLEPRRAPGA